MPIEPCERLARRPGQLGGNLLTEIGADQPDARQVATTRLPGAGHLDRAVRTRLDRRDRTARVGGPFWTPIDSQRADLGRRGSDR